MVFPIWPIVELPNQYIHKNLLEYQNGKLLKPKFKARNLTKTNSNSLVLKENKKKETLK